MYYSTCIAHANGTEALINQYLLDFATNSDLSSYFVERPQFIFGQHIHTPKSPTEASNFIRNIRKKLVDSNYRSSSIEKTKVLAEIDNYSLITFSLKRIKEDGILLDKVCSAYGVVNTENGYKILSWQPYSPSKDGEC